MIFLNLTVGLLLIIAFAEAKLECSSSCNDGKAEGNPIDLSCSGTGTGTSSALTWHNNKDKSLLHLSNPIQQPGSISGQAIAEAPDGNPWFCFGKDSNGMEQFCTLLPCKVMYLVKIVTTWPLLFASPGEEIKCMAEGNPTPTFSWEGMDESGKWMAIPGATSDTIDALLNNGTFTHLRCAAKNSVNGNESTAHSAEIIVSKDGALIRNAIIGSVVAVILIAIIVVVIIQVKCPDAMPCKLSEVFGCGG